MKNTLKMYMCVHEVVLCLIIKLAEINDTFFCSINKQVKEKTDFDLDHLSQLVQDFYQVCCQSEIKRFFKIISCYAYTVFALFLAIFFLLMHSIFLR